MNPGESKAGWGEGYGETAEVCDYICGQKG